MERAIGGCLGGAFWRLVYRVLRDAVASRYSRSRERPGDGGVPTGPWQLKMSKLPSGFPGIRKSHSAATRYRHLAAALFLGVVCTASVWVAPGAGAQEQGDILRALQVWLPLAKQGDATAQLKVGNLYARGEGVSKDYFEAMKWYRQAAEQGLPEAQFELGKYYNKGRGIPPDEVEAVRWYRMAAERGHAAAQAHLGLMYSKGRGVPQDSATAARWFQRAAQQGNATGQANLGFGYLFGQGMPRNLGKAVEWLRLAAEQGDPDAQFYLGNFYRTGKGVPKDQVQAYFWWDLATATAPLLGDLRYLAIHQRDSVASTLSPEQLKQARKLAAKWRYRHPELRLP